MYVYAEDHGTTEISLLEFGRAAHRIAHVLRPGRKGDGRQVVMIIANCDTILYQAIHVALCVAGLTVSGSSRCPEKKKRSFIAYQPFPVSPRNSAPAVVDMMKKTNCSRIVTLRHAHQSLIDEIQSTVSDCELIVDEIPTLSYAFPKLGKEVESDPFVPYPPATSRPDLNEPALYIHSSGSTGFPKPIPHSHRFQIQLLTQRKCMFFLHSGGH